MVWVIDGEATPEPMRLAIQFGLVSLTLLLVPWAGCAFLAENERALQTAQQQASRAIATTAAAVLAEQIDLIYPQSGRLAGDETQQGLPLPTLEPRPRIDGWLEATEWQSQQPLQRGGQRRQVMLYRGRGSDSLYLGAIITEPEPRYFNPQYTAQGSNVADRLLHSDRLELRLGSAPAARFTIAPEGPGRGQLLRITGDDLIPVDDTRFWWQETATGYQVEISLPLALAAGRLGIAYIGEDDSGAEAIAFSTETTALPWLIAPAPQLDDWLTTLTPPGMQMTLYDRWQWPLASAGRSTSTPATEGHWLLRWLYRQMLPGQSLAAPLAVDASGRLSQPLLGDGSGHIFKHGTAAGPRLTVTAPVIHRQTTIATVAVSRPLEEFLSLTDQAFAGLLARGLVVLLITATTLLGFAGLVSWRLRRLQHHLDATGQSSNSHSLRLPVSLLGDEIDALAGRFNQQLQALDEYQRYLSSLNQTLAHELRTPVAIVASSLENLRLPGVDESQREALLARASVGIERLQHLFTGLQEARRLEQAVGNEPHQQVDLAQLLRDLAAAYAQSFTDHRFDLIAPDQGTWATIAPEQFVQAIDKLIENAASYAPAGTTIHLTLEQRGLWWRISVENQGSQLPDVPEQSLFEPLISHRGSRRDEAASTQHLGLGLHIVRLIAQYHGGEPFAQNLPDHQGVRIGFSVRGSH